MEYAKHLYNSAELTDNIDFVPVFLKVGIDAKEIFGKLVSLGEFDCIAANTTSFLKAGIDPHEIYKQCIAGEQFDDIAQNVPIFINYGIEIQKLVDDLIAAGGAYSVAQNVPIFINYGIGIQKLVDDLIAAGGADYIAIHAKQFIASGFTQLALFDQLIKAQEFHEVLKNLTAFLNPDTDPQELIDKLIEASNFEFVLYNRKIYPKKDTSPQQIFNQLITDHDQIFIAAHVEAFLVAGIDPKQIFDQLIEANQSDTVKKNVSAFLKAGMDPQKLFEYLIAEKGIFSILPYVDTFLEVGIDAQVLLNYLFETEALHVMFPSLFRGPVVQQFFNAGIDPQFFFERLMGLKNFLGERVFFNNVNTFLGAGMEPQKIVDVFVTAGAVGAVARNARVFISFGLQPRKLFKDLLGVKQEHRGVYAVASNAKAFLEAGIDAQDMFHELMNESVGDKHMTLNVRDFIAAGCTVNECFDMLIAGNKLSCLADNVHVFLENEKSVDPLQLLGVLKATTRINDIVENIPAFLRAGTPAEKLIFTIIDNIEIYPDALYVLEDIIEIEHDPSLLIQVGRHVKEPLLLFSSNFYGLFYCWTLAYPHEFQALRTEKWFTEALAGAERETAAYSDKRCFRFVNTLNPGGSDFRVDVTDKSKNQSYIYQNLSELLTEEVNVNELVASFYFYSFCLRELKRIQNSPSINTRLNFNERMFLESLSKRIESFNELLYKVIKNYLVDAVVSELKNLQEVELKNFFVPGREVEFFSRSMRLFQGPFWTSLTGGETWVQIAKKASEIWLHDNKFSKETWIDNIFALEHNTGGIFDKHPLLKQYSLDLNRLLTEVAYSNTLEKLVQLAETHAPNSGARGIAARIRNIQKKYQIK